MFKSVVALSVSRQINFCVSAEDIQSSCKLLLKRASTIFLSTRNSARLPELTKNIICYRSEAPQTGPRPQQTSIRQGESKSAGFLFVGTIFSLLLKIKRSKNDHRKWNPEDLNYPRQELFNGGLGIVVTLLVCWQINVSCASC